jgi:general secretion pathway protein G
MKSKRNVKSMSNRGFTLVEMLLVLVILSTLAAIVYPSTGRRPREARITAARVQISSFRTALAAFEMNNDRFPKGRDGLNELVQRPNDTRNWQGPYLESIPKDPWGNDYIYTFPGKHNPASYDLVSMGPDGVLGTEDDVTNWQPGK